MALFKKKEAIQSPQFVDKPAPQISLVLPDEANLPSSEEALAKVSLILAESRNPKLLSELDDKEIRLISALTAVGERTKDAMVLNFLYNFLVLRVSHKRQGRREIIELTKGMREVQDSRFARLRNIFQGQGR